MAGTVNAGRSGVAVVGFGMTEVGRVFDRTASQLAAEAVTRAAADAGLSLDSVDGLLVNQGRAAVDPSALAEALHLSDLRLLAKHQAGGASACAMVAYAAMAVRAGMASAVACVFADTPLSPDGPVYGRPLELTGIAAAEQASGFVGTNPRYAMAARRHMHTYGTTHDQFGAIAVGQRAWAVHNPWAQHRDPLTMEQYRQSRWIAEPLRRDDICLVSNGGAAVIVTSADRARDLSAQPVWVWGWGEGHPAHPMERGSEFGLTCGAAIAGPTAMRMARVRSADITMCQIYDCYTYAVLVQLEDYGFCAKGEGGEFAASGVLGPGGALPTNTGGGQLSAYYLWGMTPLSEAIVQARGQGGGRQVDDPGVILVSGNGGVLQYHSTLILSSAEAAA